MKTIDAMTAISARSIYALARKHNIDIITLPITGDLETDLSNAIEEQNRILAILNA